MNKRLATLPNVDVSDFRDTDAVTHNLNNYRDTRHFRGSVNAWILEDLRDRSHRVSADQPTAALDRLKQQIAQYKVPNL